MSAAELVRQLLDERGVEYRTHGTTDRTWFEVGNISWFVIERENGNLTADAVFLTPEQAIAVTLGRSECHDKNGFDSDTGFECTVCGTMVDSYMVTTEDTGHYTQFNFCPNCGRKVVEE